MVYNKYIISLSLKNASLYCVKLKFNAYIQIKLSYSQAFRSGFIEHIAVSLLTSNCEINRIYNVVEGGFSLPHNVIRQIPFRVSVV